MNLRIDVNDAGVTVQHDGPNGDVVVKAVDPQELARLCATETRERAENPRAASAGFIS